MATIETLVREHLAGKAVVITGGTKGIGLACGLAFGQVGARTYLTHRWGSADEDELRRRFAEVGAPEPVIVEADVSNADRRLVEHRPIRAATAHG